MKNTKIQNRKEEKYLYGLTIATIIHGLHRFLNEKLVQRSMFRLILPHNKNNIYFSDRVSLVQILHLSQTIRLNRMARDRKINLVNAAIIFVYKTHTGDFQDFIFTFLNDVKMRILRDYKSIINIQHRSNLFFLRLIEQHKHNQCVGPLSIIRHKIVIIAL